MEVKQVHAVKLLITALFLAFVTTDVHAQFNYVINGSTAIITGYTGPGGVVTIPSSIGGRTVVEVESAFQGNYALTKIIIPTSVKWIGNMAFYSCGNLTNAVIPNSVTNIDAAAFFGCTKLTAVALPTNLVYIGPGAFQACSSLTNVFIPAKVTSIGGKAFDYCRNLQTITVDPSNTVYSSLDGVLFNKSQTSLMQCPGAKAGSYAIPDSVTTVAENAFDPCAALSDITIPTNVVSLGSFAFKGCTGLTNVFLPASITNMGDSVFGNCYGLNSIVVDPLNPYYSGAGGVLFNKSQTTLIQYPPGMLGSYTIPNSVTKIGNYAFSSCTNLSGVIIPSTITSIGNYAFESCRSLTSVTIPTSVTNIGTYAFIFCFGLVDATLPGSVPAMSEGTFEFCTNLTNITIPSSVTNIGTFGFAFCANLTEVYFAGNTPAGGSFIFNNATNAIVYYLPGTSGWTNTFAGQPTAPWLPRILSAGQSFGVLADQFGFNINWASGRTVVVETAEDFAPAIWTPVSTNYLTTNTASFTDPDWAIHPKRFYRLRSL